MCRYERNRGGAVCTVIGFGAGAERASRSLAMTAGSVPGPCKSLQFRPTTRSLPQHAQHELDPCTGSGPDV